LDKFVDGIRGAARLSGIVAGIFLTCMVTLVVLTVVLRPIGITITGSYEILAFLAVFTIAGALVYTAYRGSHITVRILISKLAPKYLRIAEIMHAVLGIAMLLLLVWANNVVIQDRWDNELTDVLIVPMPPFRVVWALGMVLFCLVLVTDLIITLRNEGKK
jgi:TRAP-type C4-dicarboxylate transport system permease small subunit